MDLATLNASQPAQLVKFNESDIYSVTQSSGFLPRLSIGGSSSNPVKEGKVRVGNLYLAIDKDNVVDLGPEIDLLLVSVRTKALKITDEAIIENFDRNSEVFKQIAAESLGKDSGCMYGAEFLVWIPDNGFATYFCGSKTGRREAPNLLVIMKDGGEAFKIMPATIKTKLITGGKYKWHGGESSPCNAPFASFPEMDKLQETVSRFNNPPKPKVETVAASETDNRAR